MQPNRGWSAGVYLKLKPSISITTLLIVNKKPKVSKIAANYGRASLFLVLAGCAYYPPNYGPIASFPGNSVTIVTNYYPTYPAVNIYADDTIYAGDTYNRYVSLLSATKNFREGDFHFSPSVFFLGLGMGAGYIFQSKTVVSLFSGVSFNPTSLGSGISISQAVGKHLFFNYDLNYAKFHRLSCAFGCTMTDSGEFETFHSLGAEVLLSNLFLNAHVDIYNKNNSDPKIGFAIGYYGN